jgi:hypothetical protein
MRSTIGARADGTYVGKGCLKEPFVLDEDGFVAVPQQPGLGIELDEAGMREIMARPWSTQRRERRPTSVQAGLAVARAGT